jgi:hypothetical protein
MCLKEVTMSGLQRFERKLETMISGGFAKVFRSAVQPVEIAAALQREVDNNAQILSRERRIVPNEFHVELSTADLQRFGQYGPTLTQELTDQLTEYARGQGYVFPGAVSIRFGEADDLTVGRFRVRSTAKAKVESDAMTNTQIGRAYAWLEVNNGRHPLTGNVVVGRGADADLRINDPGISRRHIEFISRQDGVEVRDLGSTNGMLVNGAKIPAATVVDGTHVRIGNTTLIVHIEGGQA